MLRRLVFSTTAMFLVMFMWVFIAGAAEKKDAGPELVLEVMELIQEYHISTPDPSTLADEAIQGMLDNIDDKYAVFFDAEELKVFTDSLNGDLVGIGVELTLQEKHPMVVRVLPGTPAERGGLQRDDVILAVDGKSTGDRLLLEVTFDIRGPRGTPVELTIKRGEKEFDLTLERADVHVPTVSNEMLAGNTGYIAVSSFGERTTGEFELALLELRGQGMDSLIIDLRGNGGGFLNKAVDILDNFMPRDSLVVSTLDGRGNREEIRSLNEATVANIPLAVLVDLGSASASEIMAGALRDHGLATLVGAATYGKGVVQTMFPL
ncbi:MAG: S41 family peptidase, partial [Firmicutes bacterium]|nr:S41 family peptidase [Bacillota bacterium]